MAGKNPDHGSYTYPPLPGQPDSEDVLRNRFDIRSREVLKLLEHRFVRTRTLEVIEGRAPTGQFDADHFRALHRHLFGDVYEWAGHTRNERPIVDGMRLDAIGGLAKGETEFLHGSRIETGLHESFKHISVAELRMKDHAHFAEVAGDMLSSLNYVHPFRDGNGRTQEVMTYLLGRETGHMVDFSVITKVRMDHVSIATANNPGDRGFRDLLADAIEPGRSAALG